MRALPALLLLLTAACSALGDYDGGGPLMPYLVRHEQGELGGPLRGTCLSSCAVRLAWAECVDPALRVGVHEVRDVGGGDYGGGVRHELWTGFYSGLIPACARAVFEARGGFRGPALVYATGRELLDACPQMRPCGRAG